MAGLQEHISPLIHCGGPAHSRQSKDRTIHSTHPHTQHPQTLLRLQETGSIRKHSRLNHHTDDRQRRPLGTEPPSPVLCMRVEDRGQVIRCGADDQPCQCR